MGILGRLLDSLYITEDTCTNCGKTFEPSGQGFVCDECIGEIKPYHPLEYEEKPFIAGYRIFSLYEGAIKEVIKAIKFRRALPLVEVLAGRIRGHINEYLQEIEPQIITFVPVHFWRRWGRGFDQNEELLKSLKIPFLRVLERHRYARSLARYGKSERHKIVEDAFRVKGHFLDLVEGKRILVLDDLMTTGSTAQSVARTLLEVGADSVYFYFLAKEL